MRYEFRRADGTIVERVFPMGKAPSIGATIRDEDGSELTRIASSAQVDGRPMDSMYPYVSHALSRNLRGCKTDRVGRPIIESKKHEREVMARHNLVRA